MLRILICLLLFYGFGYLEASILDSRGICQNLFAAVSILHDILAEYIIDRKDMRTRLDTRVSRLFSISM